MRKKEKSLKRKKKDNSRSFRLRRRKLFSCTFVAAISGAAVYLKYGALEAQWLQKNMRSVLPWRVTVQSPGVSGVGLIYNTWLQTLQDTDASFIEAFRVSGWSVASCGLIIF